MRRRKKKPRVLSFSRAYKLIQELAEKEAPFKIPEFLDAGRIADVLRQEAPASESGVVLPGAPRYAEFEGFDLNGLKIFWAKGHDNEKRKAGHIALEIVRWQSDPQSTKGVQLWRSRIGSYLLKRGLITDQQVTDGYRIPKSLLKNLRAIYVVPEECVFNKHWEMLFGMPGFKSAATTTGDRITVYKSGKLQIDSFMHELAHMSAKETWGSPEPPPGSDFGRAQLVEGPISDYADQSGSLGEDFADSVTAFMLGAFKLPLVQAAYQKKWQALKWLLKLK